VAKIWLRRKPRYEIWLRRRQQYQDIINSLKQRTTLAQVIERAARRDPLPIPA